MAWYLRSDGYIESGNHQKTDDLAVRCVRGTPTTHEQHFERSTLVTTQPTVIDLWTGLEWQGCVKGRTGEDCEIGSAVECDSWQCELAYCEALQWAGHWDWRLPNVQEARSIVDNRLWAPPLDQDFFPQTPTEKHGTSTTRWDIIDASWTLATLLEGNIGGHSKQEDRVVRCVRDAE